MLKKLTSIDTPSMAYLDMQKHWELPEALRGGVEAMRNKTWLPQEPRESNAAYEVRKSRSFLYNLYWRVINSITALAFIKPVNISNVPKELEYLQWNFDGNNRSLTEFAYDMTIDAIHYGLSHAVMEFPKLPYQMNLKEFRESGYKPYGVLVNPTQVIGVKFLNVDGVTVPNKIRIMYESIEERSDDEWGEKLVKRIKIYSHNGVEIHRYDSEFDTGFTPEEVVNTELGIIPMVTCYSNKVGEMKGYPALADLASLNLCHFQSSSDQRNILHIARVPIILAAGFDEDELDGIEIGANRMIRSSNAEAKIEHVEHSGSAMKAGSDDLDKLEMQMATLGAEMLLSKSVSRQTATARRIDQNESMSTLQLTLRSVERAIEVMYEIAGRYIGVDASNVSVSIGDDLSSANEPNPTTALIALWQTGLLTEEQVVDEAKRQGILSTYFTLDSSRKMLQVKSKETNLSNTETNQPVETESENDDQVDENQE